MQLADARGGRAVGGPSGKGAAEGHVERRVVALCVGAGGRVLQRAALEAGVDSLGARHPGAVDQEAARCANGQPRTEARARAERGRLDAVGIGRLHAVVCPLYRLVELGAVAATEGAEPRRRDAGG